MSSLMHQAAGRLARLLGGSSLLLVSTASLAGNGLNDLAFGARSYGMAGTDIATASDATAVNVNPAGLASIGQRRLDVYAEPFAYPGISHSDALGNDENADTPYGLSMGFGYAQRLNPTVVVGTGLFAQGGAGFSYMDLKTPFGTREDLISKFATVKLTPGISWQAHEALDLGLSLGINYSAARQNVFLGVSYVDPQNPQASFSGFRADDLSGVSFNAKAGFRYRPHRQWLIAGNYTSQAAVKLKGGRLKSNEEASNLGRVTYGKASQSGLNFAREVGLGLAFNTADERWMVSGEVNWLDWSSAMKTSTLRASKPNNPQAKPSLEYPTALNWRDQYVVALGAEHRLSERSLVRAGINYGRNPVPDETLSAAFPLIGEKTVAAGFTRKLGEPWEFTFAALYQLRDKVRYLNPSSPFGESTESFDALALQLMFTRQW